MRRTLLALLLLSTPAFAQKQPQPQPAPSRPAPAERNIVLRNNSQSVIREVYLWEPSTRAQGPDRLGADVVRPNATYRVNLGRVGCQFQLRAVFEDGGAETRAVDVCRTQEVVLDDRNTRPIDVANNTDAELMQLFLSRPGNIGPDRLGTSIVPGNDSLRIRLRGETACEFDARAVFRGAREETRRNVNICTTPSIAFGDASIPLREVTVANRGTRVLRELFAAPGTGDWGADRLGATVLNPGQSFLLRTRSQECRMRMRAVFADNRALEQPDVDICAGREVVFSTARRVTLVQSNARAVREAYLSPVTENDWGANLLATPLPRGERREIGTDGDCQADLRIVFDNGNAEEARNLNICERTEIELKPGWITD